MKLRVLISILFFIPFHLIAQFDGYIPTKSPLTPTTFQFLKYTENPVNEYNGVPKIEIPIYTINAGQFTFPITLTYHAGGIRVAEEASWVGLGWDLDVGTITQIVNDRDDLDLVNYQHILPDYLEWATPYVYPFEYDWPYMTQTEPIGGWPVSTGISQIHPKHSIVTYTNYYYPFNNTHSNQNYYLFNAYGWINGDNIDSEPDVFKAVFNGHYIEFTLNFSTGEVILLNQKGYIVNKYPLPDGKNGWTIISPDGVTYSFIDITETSTEFSQTKFDGGAPIYQPENPELTNRIWHLSKITTVDSKEINFGWTYTQPVYQFPSFSQTFKDINTGSIYTLPSGWVGQHFRDVSTCYPGTGNGCGAGIDYGPNQHIQDIGFSSSKYSPSSLCYVNSISFPLGIIQFISSNGREDFVNNNKLNSILIYHIDDSGNHLNKQFDLAYDYFIGSNSGVGYDTEPYLSTFGNKSTTEKLNRLKLLSLTESGAPPYLFNYNPTALPSKCSFATDYWGFYNGKTNNVSLIPNPTDLGLSQSPANNDDHKAYLACSKAATLESITYPTGGSTSYIYDLNTFSPSSVPNTGNGLRVSSIINKIGGQKVSQTDYLYSGGIALSPLRFDADDSYQRATYLGGATNFMPVSCKILSSSNYYSSSLLGSGNSTGYSEVISKQIDENGQENGHIRHLYQNIPDIGNDFLFSRNYCLPLRKDENFPSNGLLKKEEIYNNSGDLIKMTENEYSFTISPVSYGARIMFNQLYGACLVWGGNPELYTYEQDYCGYYPIYSGWSLLNKSTVTEYQSPQLFVRTITDYQYNSALQISQTSYTNSDGVEMKTKFKYPSDYSSNSSTLDDYSKGINSMKLRNYINKPVEKVKSIKINANSNEFTTEGEINFFKIDPNYKFYLDNIKKIETTTGLYSFTLSSISDNGVFQYNTYYRDNCFFDLYDNYRNLLQSHKQNNNNISTIWGYDNMYQVIRAENIGYNTLLSVVNNVTFGLQGLLYEIEDLTTSSQKTIWNNFNLALRSNSSLSNSLVTTYTYKPLVGITSSTDPAGITTYYEYDAFNRLSLVRDFDGNIVKTYDYHYTSQTEKIK